MKYRITLEAGYLSAELFERETAGESSEFLVAVSQESLRRRCPLILVCVRSSSIPVSILGSQEVLACFNTFRSDLSHKIAVVGDTLDLGMTHDHIQALAGLHGINIRSFPTESVALHWLKDQRKASDRRHEQRRHDPQTRPPPH
jgi:hypothetical protein